MGGPDRPGGRAKQCSRKGLRLKQAGGGRGIGGGVCALCERVSKGGGHCCELSRKDLGGQGPTGTLLPQNQLDLLERERQSIQRRSRGGVQIQRAAELRLPQTLFLSLMEQKDVNKYHMNE